MNLEDNQNGDHYEFLQNEYTDRARHRVIRDRTNIGMLSKNERASKRSPSPLPRGEMRGISLPYEMLYRFECSPEFGSPRF